MKKENIYLDMSKLTEKQQKKVISLLPEAVSSYQYQIIKRENCIFLLFETNMKIWLVVDINLKITKKTEITYKEFKKLMKKENKEKFVLPKKWCVKNKGHKDLIDYANEHGANPTYYLNDNAYFHFPFFLMGEHKGTTSFMIEQGFTEITIKQFRKHVLKKKKTKETNTMKVKIKKLHKDAVIPQYAKQGDAGLDLTAVSKEYDENGNVVYGTGLAFEIPEGFVGLLFPRSSNAKKDLLLSNSVGVLDSGYRGEVLFKFKKAINSEKLSNNILEAILDIFKHEVRIDKINWSNYEIGDRIGQLIILPYPNIEFEEVAELSETERGCGGYGHSGN